MYVNGVEGSGRAFGLGMEGGGVAGAGGSGSGDDPEAAGSRDKKKKRYHRHTARQIQQLEACVSSCSSPAVPRFVRGSFGVGCRDFDVFWNTRSFCMECRDFDVFLEHL